MSEILNDVGFYPSLPNGRIAADDPFRRFLADPDAEGGVALTRKGYSLRRIVEQSSMRLARVRAIRTEIESGSFETSERIRGTVDRLLQVIR